MDVQIDDMTPPVDTIAANLFRDVDYRDAFLVAGASFATVDDAARAYFLNQPQWISIISMNVLSRKAFVDVVASATFEAGTAVGAWKVYDRSADEIVFGDDMGFMEYRFSLRLRPEGHVRPGVEASTVVRYRWRRASHFYFTLVKPFHRLFVPMSLKAMVRPAPGDLAIEVAQ